MHSAFVRLSKEADMSAGNSALGLMAGFSCTKKRSSNCAVYLVDRKQTDHERCYSCVRFTDLRDSRMMGMQISKLKFENFIYQQLKFSQGLHRHLVWYATVSL